MLRVYSTLQSRDSKSVALLLDRQGKPSAQNRALERHKNCDDCVPLPWVRPALLHKSSTEYYTAILCVEVLHRLHLQSFAVRARPELNPGSTAALLSFSNGIITVTRSTTMTVHGARKTIPLGFASVSAGERTLVLCSYSSRDWCSSRPWTKVQWTAHAARSFDWEQRSCWSKDARQQHAWWNCRSSAHPASPNRQQASIWNITTVP